MLRSLLAGSGRQRGTRGSLRWGAGLPLLAAADLDDIKFLAPAGDDAGLETVAAPTVLFYQCIQSCLIETARLVPRTRIGKFAGKKSEWTNPAVRHIADRFCNQNPFFRGCDHPLNHARCVRQEMVEAALNGHVFSARQRSVFLEVPYDTASSVGAKPVGEMPVDIQAGIMHTFCLEITMKQRARSATDIQYRGAFGN